MGRSLFVQYGEEYNISVKFVLKKPGEIKVIQPSLEGRLGREWNKLPDLQNKNLQNKTLQEPLQKGDMYTFKMLFPVRKAYPEVSFYRI